MHLIGPVRSYHTQNTSLVDSLPRVFVPNFQFNRARLSDTISAEDSTNRPRGRIFEHFSAQIGHAAARRGPRFTEGC